MSEETEAAARVREFIALNTLSPAAVEVYYAGSWSALDADLRVLLSLVGGGGGNRNEEVSVSQSQPCAEAGAHIPLSPHVLRLLAASSDGYWEAIEEEVQHACDRIRHASLLNHQAAHTLAWANLARNAVEAAMIAAAHPLSATTEGSGEDPPAPKLKEIEEIAGRWRATSYDAATCEKPERCRWLDCKCVGKAFGGREGSGEGEA